MDWRIISAIRNIDQSVHIVLQASVSKVCACYYQLKAVQADGEGT